MSKNISNSSITRSIMSGGRDDRHAANDNNTLVLTQTVGEAFPSGAMLDLVRNPEQDRIELAHWDGSSISIRPRVDLNGRIFVPPALDDDLVREIQLPSNTADFGSTAALFDDLQRVFKQHPGLSEEGVSKAAFSSLATWFPERSAPLLFVSATDCSGSRLLLEQLRCVCRRSFVVGDITRSGMWSLPLSLHPTIIIDRPTLTKELMRVLHAVSRPGVRVPQKGHLLDVLCPVVLCTEESIGDEWLLANSIQISLAATANRLPRIASQSLRDISRELQPKLLSYRFRNFAKVQHSDFDAPQLTFPTREIAQTLGDCIVDDCELQSRVISLLEAQNEDTRVRRTMTFEAVVVEAGLLFCHEKKKRESAYVAEFATVAKAILENRGERVKLESRAVGDILRCLGLFTCRLDRAGRGIRLLRDVRKKFHQLAWRYGVRSIDDGIDRCEFCTQARAQFGDSVHARM